MRCVVSGGNGFIGGHVVAALEAAGHEAIILDREGVGENIDICNTAAITSFFGDLKPQFVFHLAGIADARQALKDPVHAVQVNVAGTASVFEAARRTGVERVVLASTCWVANAMSSGVLDESAPFLPEGGSHVYTTTKIACEMLAHDFQKLYGLPFTILRYGIPYGPRMWSGLVLRNFLDCALAGKPLTIYGDGSASRKFVFEEDLAQAHVLALQDVAANQAYNLEGMRFVTIRELAELVSRLAGPVKIEYIQEPSRIGEFQYFRKLISSNKAYIELGWEARIDLEEGVRRTIEWYRAEKALGEEVASAASRA